MKREARKEGSLHKCDRRGERGAALLISILMLAVLITLTSGFAVSTVSELKNANRYRDAVVAFWLAEAGMNNFLQDPTLLNGGDQWIYYGNHYVHLTKDDTDPQTRYVTATGVAGGVTRQIESAFPANPPGIFNNTMSTGGNLRLVGILAKLEVFGPTRLSGTYQKIGIGASGWFEDKVESVPSASTTFQYPDTSGNGTADEFSDFVAFNRAVVSTYEPSEVVYIQSDNTQFVYPGSGLSGKKVLFVEGSTPGAGDVDVFFDAGWQDDQNLTVISTGTVDYVQPLQLNSDSQLNIISWDGYNEASILYSTHDGVTFTHDTADFYSIFEYSVTDGNLIANAGINANEALSWKRFDYGDPLVDGNIPPGFQGLVTQLPGGYSSIPNAWKEI